MNSFVIRAAIEADIPEISSLVDLAIGELMNAFLTPEEVAASRHIMGVDRELVRDGTYFLVFDGDQLAGCGGWSRRETLFGGDETAGRNSRLLDPETEPARVRAMYTHPDWTRRGIGKLVLETCEGAARAENFRTVELAATQAGKPLYLAAGYIPVEDWREPTPDGVTVPLTRMNKPL